MADTPDSIIAVPPTTLERVDVMPSAAVSVIARRSWTEVPTQVQALADAVETLGKSSFRHEEAVIEAVASSAIENIHATVAQTLLAFNHEAHPSVTDEGRAVAANLTAARGIFHQRNAYSPECHRPGHDTLMRGQKTPEKAGGLRTHGVTVGGNLTPAARRVPELMDDLVSFVKEHPRGLVHSAVAHGQFETIHPYPDGNGRIGRALLAHMLGRPVSLHLARERRSYYDALRDYRLGDATPLVMLIGRAVIVQESAFATVKDRMQTMWRQADVDLSRAAHMVLFTASRRIVGTKRMLLGNRDEAGFQELVKKGFLEPVSDDLGGDTVWAVIDILGALTEQADVDPHGTKSESRWVQLLHV